MGGYEPWPRKLTQCSKPGCGRVAVAAHVPLADQRRLRSPRAAGTAGRTPCSDATGCVVVDHAVLVRVQAGQDGGARGRAQRGADEGVREVHAALRASASSCGVSTKRCAHEADRVVALVVGDDQDDVARRDPRDPRERLHVRAARGCASGPRVARWRPNSPRCRRGSSPQSRSSGAPGAWAFSCRSASADKVPLRPARCSLRKESSWGRICGASTKPGAAIICRGGQ